MTQKLDKQQAYWDEIFKHAHDTSWPTPSVSMAGDIHERDKEYIQRAAKRYGYTLQISAKNHIRYGK